MILPIKWFYIISISIFFSACLSPDPSTLDNKPTTNNSQPPNQPTTDNSPPPKQPPKDSTQSEKKYLTRDVDILANLKQHLKLKNVATAGDGRCLFNSLQGQITQAELIAQANLLPAALNQKALNYDARSRIEKSDLLREITIFLEKDFLITKNNLAKKFDQLAPDEQHLALEMAKDWYQEVKGNTNETREWYLKNLNDLGKQQMWEFVARHRDAYWQKTSCVTNWSGSTEAIVLARLLKRPVKMYGRDNVSSEKGAELNPDGVVIPYLEYNYGYPGKPLLVFQTSGGGHYELLVEEN